MLSKSRFIEMFSEYKTKQLSDISDITMGQSPDSNTYNSHGEGLAFYQGKTDFTDKYISSPKVWCKTPLRVARAGDILMSVRAPVGDVNITSKNCCIGRGLASIRPKNLESTEFIFLALQQSKHKIASIGKGSTFKAINKNDVFSIKIPDAPLSLQKDFSNFSIQLDKSKFILQQMIEKLELLKKSRFIELIGDYDLSLKKKEWIYLKDLGEIVGGATPKTSDPLLWDGNFKWITPAELTESTYIITESERHLTQMGVKSCSLQTLPKGTVLLTSRAPIGKVAIAGVDMFCNQGFKNIICGKGLRAKYLCYLLKLNSRYLNDLGRGATFKEISKSIVEKIAVPAPPLEVQDKFISFIDQIDKSKLVLQKALENLVGKV